MRWLAIKRKDGEVDPFAVGYCTHTVATTFHNGKRQYTAWKLASKGAVILGVFDKPEGAQLLVEQDARGKG